MSSADEARLLAGRYRLEEVIGEGGFGVVYRAQDAVRSKPVAIKIYSRIGPDDVLRIHREIAALRLLRLPGVVNLLDDGVDQGELFVAMDLIAGTPFPGVGKPLSWQQLEPLALRVLEVLAKVHEAGVIHRDIKPANLLVSARGEPTLLDFGLSYGEGLGSRITSTGAMLGTPAYLAPEQIRGSRVDARADLYAFGVMLYEALANRLPHEASSGAAMLGLRLSESARPIGELLPALPPVVARLVDRLLAREPDLRPRSAHEILAYMRGDWQMEAGPSLPWLGGRDAVAQISARLRAGRGIDVAGPAGAGRSRTLREALVETGCADVVRLIAGAMPFASVVPLLPTRPGDGLGLAAVRELLSGALSARLRAGAVIVADPWHTLDRWSARLLEPLRDQGALVRVVGPRPAADDVVSMGPLAPKDLRPLFAGSGRLLHAPDDAAELLWLASRGLPGRIAEEVARWRRAGHVTWDADSRLVVSREGVGRLRAELAVDEPAEEAFETTRRAWSSAALTPRITAPRRSPDRDFLRDILGWAAIAGPERDPRQLAQIVDQPVWAIEAALAELRQLGAITPAGVVPTLALGEPLDHWSADRRRAAHAAVARVIEPGAPRRLYHLVAARDYDAVPEEAIAQAQKAERRGRTSNAAGILREALALVRGVGDASAEATLLRHLTRVTLVDGLRPSHESLLYELTRAAGEPSVERLRSLARASLDAITQGGEAVLARLEEIGPFEEADLELCRQRVRVAATRGCSVEVARAVVAELVRWAEGEGAPALRAAAYNMAGHQRYREARYLDAVAAHEEVLALGSDEVPLGELLSARLNAAGALMELHRHAEAAAHADLAKELAAKARVPRHEAHAEWHARHARYRAGESLQPDLDLVAAAGQLGLPTWEAIILLNEAVIAWRAGQGEVAADLARRGARLAEATGMTSPAVAGRALGHIAGGTWLDPEQAAAEVASLRGETDASMTLQSLGLIAGATETVPADWTSWGAELAAQLSPDELDIRIDVLAPNEALAMLGAPPRRT